MALHFIVVSEAQNLFLDDQSCVGDTSHTQLRKAVRKQHGVGFKSAFGVKYIHPQQKGALLFLDSYWWSKVSSQLGGMFAWQPKTILSL